MATLSEETKDQIVSLIEEGLGREQIASRVGVSPGTVSAIKAHITMGRYGGRVVSSQAETDELIEASEATFGLERDLQSALRLNIEQLEAGLEIIDGGKERTTDAGRIDITAKGTAGTTVVIELKAGEARPEALTQLLAYMGELGGQEQRQVRGILVAGDFHRRIVFAAKATPNVQLRRYRFRFDFEAV